MFHLIRSELLKMRHTFALKLFIAAPVVTLGLGYFLSGKSVQLTAYNWWYTLILPITIAIWCANIISCEKRTQYQNILCLPIAMRKIWFSKLLAVTVLLFLTSLVMWGGCTAFGIFTVMNIDPLNGLGGCMLLFLTYIWQLPLIMWLTKKANYLIAVLISFGCNIVLSMMARKLVDGKYVKYMLYPKLGEKARNNGHVVYSLDFDVTPHMLRHTYITNLIHASVDPKTVQYLAGHESSKITMDIYAKVKYNKPEQLAGVLSGAFAEWDGGEYEAAQS